MKKYNFIIESHCPYCVYSGGFLIAKFLRLKDAQNFIKYKEFFDLEVEDEKKKC